MRAVVVSLGLTLVSSLVGGVSAQEFDMRTTTRVEFGGAFGFIMNLMGANDVQSQRTMVSGPLSTIRTDDITDGKLTDSNIMDYSSGVIQVVDHEDKSYYTFNFADLMASGPFQFGNEPPPADYQEPEPREDGAEYDVTIEFETPGNTKQIQNYTAEETRVKITATPTKAPEGVSLDSMPIFIMYTSLWSSEEFPGNDAMREVSAEAAAQMSKSMGLDGEAMAQAFSQNPQFANAFEMNQAEMEKLQNMTLEQLTVFISLTQDAQFNPDSALYGSMGEMKIDVAGAVASGVQNAITGGIRGRLGIGRRREPEPPPPPAPVMILMFRVHEVLDDFNTGPLMAGWNVVPGDYQQKESPFQRQPN